ncbi:Long-chain-alcohol O-fatty-acyltransferase [Bienertia sinuspersici]
MGDEANNFCKSCIIVLASLIYSYLIPSKLPKGKIRFLSLLPIFYLFITLPLSLSRPIPITILSWFISWLANSKLLLYSFDIGPLSTQNSMLNFILIGALPIKIKVKNPPNFTPPPRILPPNNWLRTFFFTLFVLIYDVTKSWVMFGFALFLFIDLCFAICAFLVGPFGLDLEEPSDEPYASSSLQDFWGRRWNRMVSDALRHTIYKPIKSYWADSVGLKWAQVIGTLATFIVSGLVHELLYYHVTRVGPTWEVTCFFVLHGVCVVLEIALKRELGWNLGLHWAVSGPLTVGFVMTTGYWLFFPPLWRNHVDSEAIEDVKAFVYNLKEIILWSIVLASLCYCYFIVSKFTNSKIKLFSLLPIFTLFTILPLSLSSVLPTGITAFFITWLANFKLLQYAFNHGPLSNPTLSFLNFILIAVFPIKIKHPFSQIKKPTINLISNFWLKTLIFSIFVGICNTYRGILHPFLVFVIYCCMLYFFLDIIIIICNKIVGSILGVELSPPSDEPYVSSSLQDFWGKRWNLMVTDVMRHTVYKPMRAFLSFYLGPTWAQVPAVMAVFLVSGLMHELIFYYITRVSPTWEVTWFFVLHGLCLILEVCLKYGLGRKLGLHWAVSGPLAVGFVMGTGYWWFFPPLLRNHIDVRATEEVMTLYDFVKRSLKIKILS